MFATIIHVFLIRTAPPTFHHIHKTTHFQLFHRWSLNNTIGTAMTIEQLQAQLKEAQEQNRLCNYAKAEEMVHEVLRWCDELQVKENPTELETLRVVGNLLIGETLWRRGQVMEAIPFAETARTCSEKLKSIEYSIQYRLLFANIYLRISEYQTSLGYIEEAENIATKYGREKDLVRIKYIKGEIYLRFRTIQETATVFNEVVDLAKFSLMEDYTIRAIINLGTCLMYLGEYDKAMELWSRLLEDSKAEGDLTVNATVMANIGAIHLAQGEYLTSIKWLQKSLLIIQDIELFSLKGSIFTNIASNYSGLGDYHLSLKFSFEALKILKRCGDIRQIAICSGNIATLYFFLENFNKSEEYFLSSIEMLNSINLDAGIYLFNYAKLLFKQNRIDEAMNHLNQAVRLSRDNQNIIEESQFNHYLCKIYINNNEFDKAKEIAFRRYKVFCEHNRNDEIPGSLDLLGDLYANPGFDEYNVELAEQYYLQALDKFVENGAKHGIYHSHQHIAQFYKELGRWEEYAAHIEKSMEIYKEVQTDEVKKQADRFGW
ncbi:MAG: tetratricopeptide repeat protein, partial [Chlorobi bacterium]|nr:tetratricopeptide repeat protein [Chlorobiota bacterium]